MFTSNPRASSTTDFLIYGAHILTDHLTDMARIVGFRRVSGEQSYIKASTSDLAGSVGIAIDSNVYILKADGTVSRLPGDEVSDSSP